jgi:hypothetical protein
LYRHVGQNAFDAFGQRPSEELIAHARRECLAFLIMLLKEPYHFGVHKDKVKLVCFNFI